ncbi:MAG: hypothetical protein E6G78_22535, partial [Alphaproteobacteria bacterium]
GSGLANYKRPRRYVFVKTIPRSPVGKLLRRKLVAGEYEPEDAVAAASAEAPALIRPEAACGSTSGC